MLYELLTNGFGIKEDYNCAEKILYGANQAYNMGLDPTSLKLSGGFGGGMFIGDTCGAVTAGIMVISHFVNDSVAHRSVRLKELVVEFQSKYTALNESTQCTPLKEQFRTEEHGCLKVITDAALILDEMLTKNEIL